MRNKILAELVKKFPGLSQKFLGLVADKLATKVTEESGIEQAVTDYDNAVSIKDLATEFQKEGDRRVTDAKKEWEKHNPKGSGKTEDDDEDSDDDDEPGEKGKPGKKDRTPKWARDLMAEVQTLKAEKSKTSIQSRLAEKLKGKVPDKFYSKRALPEKEEDIENFVAEIEADYTEFKQGLVNEGLMVNGTPVGGGTDGSEPSANAVKADIDRYMSKKEPAKKN